MCNALPDKTWMLLLLLLPSLLLLMLRLAMIPNLCLLLLRTTSEGMHTLNSDLKLMLV